MYTMCGRVGGGVCVGEIVQYKIVLIVRTIFNIRVKFNIRTMFDVMTL